jgi:hypothetical protein
MIGKKIFLLGGLLVFWILSFGISNCFAANLVWEQPESGIVSGYRIYYGENVINLAKIADVGSTNREYSLDSISLEPKKTYYFAVTAYNVNGEGEFSEIVSYTVGDRTPPAPPTGFNVE